MFSSHNQNPIVMKKFVLLPFILMLFFTDTLSAKVIRVNNQEPTNADQSTYNNLQDGYNSAVSGDTLYIEGSNIPYGSLDVFKRLVFLGPGYFLSENEGLSANKMEAVLRILFFGNGSSGSTVIGLSFTDSFSNAYSIYLSTNDIEISRCLFSRGTPILIQLSNIEEIVIQGCYFSSGVFQYGNSSIQSPKGVFFSNNIVQSNFSLRDFATGTISNNLFIGNTFNVGTNSNLQIHNNILLGTSSNTVVLPEATSNISHNISVSDQFPNSNNNQPNTVAADIFITGDNTNDGKYKIREGGPADGTGRNGADIGPFGGQRPYKLSGLPGIPVVFDFSTDGFGNAEKKLPITIKVRSN